MIYILVIIAALAAIAGGIYYYKYRAVPSLEPSRSGTMIDGTYVPSGAVIWSKGFLWLPKNLVTSVEPAWYDGQDILASTYRLPEYDPETPPIIIDGEGYYFRQLAKGMSCDP